MRTSSLRSLMKISPSLVRLSLLAILFSFTLISASARSAHISLHASWNATSPAAEAAVYFLELSGPDAATSMLTDFSTAVEQFKSDEPELTQLSEREERALLYKAVYPNLASSLGLSTLRWTLSARVHSPRIRLHYGLAEHAHSVFSVPAENSIFATVPALSDDSEVHVITNPSEISTVQSSGASTVALPTLLRSKTGDYVPFVNCGTVLKPSIMLYAHAAHKDLAKWIRALSETKHCTGIRFAAPDVLYAPPRSKPPLQAFVAHATLRSTEYKVIDDRVFETRLFPDCPEGVNRSLCKAQAIGDSEIDPYTWHNVADDKNEDLVLSSLQASMFITELAKKKNSNDGVAALLDSLRIYAEDAPGVTRSTIFRDALKDWWTASDEKAAYKIIRRFRGVVGEPSFVMLNGFHLDIDGMRQGIEPLLACLSSTSSAAHHLLDICPDSDTSKTLPPRATASNAAENSARVRVLLPVGGEHASEEKEGDNLSQSAAVWLNNMHSDSRYKKWPELNFSASETVTKFVKGVRDQIGRKVSAGLMHLQLVKIRAHVVTMVLVVDPADLEQLGYLSIPETIVRGDLPIRVALVLVPNSRSSKLIAATFHHLLRVNGRKTAVQFISMLTQVIQYFGNNLRGASVLPESMINLAFQQISSASEYETPSEILAFDQKVQRPLEDAQAFAEKLRLFSDIDPNDQSSEDEEEEYENVNGEKAKTHEEKMESEKVKKQVSMLCVLNGIVVKDVARDLVTLAVKEQQRVADLMESGVFGEVSDVQQMNPEQWISADANLIVVRKLSEEMRSEGTGRSSFGAHSSKDTSMRMAARDVVALVSDARDVTYIDNGVQSDDYKVTVWLTGSSQSSEEFKRARKLLEAAAMSEFALQTYSRFAIVNEGSGLRNAIMRTALQSASGTDGEDSTDDQSVFFINGHILLGSKVLFEDDLFVEIASEYQSVTLPSNLHGESRLIYKLFEREISEACSKGVRGSESLITQEKLLKAVSDVNGTSTFFEPSPNWASIIEEHAESNEKVLNVFAVVDPTDDNAFIIVSLLRALHSAYSSDDMTMGLAVIPGKESAKMKFSPPNTFYRFALSSDDLPVDVDSGSKIDEPYQDRFPTRVSFDRMPHDMVMTLAVEPPRPWFVSSSVTNYDMDNIILSQVNGGNDLFSEYALRNLIVEGSCIDEKERPPQGLKLVLSDGQGVTVDTLVMANLGYFQLKVPNPGMWWLSLARGASSRIYSLLAMDMFKDGGRSIFEADSDGRVPVPVQSLSGAGGILLRVVHKPGMEGESVLEANGENEKDEEAGQTEGPQTKESSSGNVMNKLKATFNRFMSGEASAQSDDERSGTGEDESISIASNGVDDDETINVFSVASGHLYERFLKIMISSVTKHASRKVKFWLLENYLSPSFKKALPEFAREHGATVGMVTYRWPGWLRAQTEKQRIIWAYKILFLDVLFPLDVNRIIFVDSDQVIRGDLAELMDIDLKGAPYGYVPFCDSRKEVEGYRFWKSGFWKETLRGQKYRISALYVVDLKRFRETAAGDTLRFIYQSLSADPNSLSNLDQDLPNYASVNSATGSSVPIFNLPQEWLWCESWCDDISKTSAKAIDLCNNPMTKEPKLDSAKRIISEWVDLDNNASALTEVIYKRLAGQPIISPPTSSFSLGEGDSEKTEL